MKPRPVYALFFLATVITNPLVGLDDVRTTRQNDSPRLQVILRFDTNKDGLLEHHEIPGSALGFAKNVINSFGASVPTVGEPLNLNDLVKNAREQKTSRALDAKIQPHQETVSAKAKAATLVVVMDQDKNGFLDANELGNRKSRMEKLDLNRDGKVTTEEFQTWFIRVEHDLNKQVLGEHAPLDFQALDSNGDGQLQMPEFCKPMNQERVREFDLRDTNLDGVIEQREWLMHLHRPKKVDGNIKHD